MRTRICLIQQPGQRGSFCLPPSPSPGATHHSHVSLTLTAVRRVGWLLTATPATAADLGIWAPECARPRAEPPAVVHVLHPRTAVLSRSWAVSRARREEDAPRPTRSG